MIWVIHLQLEAIIEHGNLDQVRVYFHDNTQEELADGLYYACAIQQLEIAKYLYNSGGLLDIEYLYELIHKCTVCDNLDMFIFLYNLMDKWDKITLLIDMVDHNAYKIMKYWLNQLNYADINTYVSVVEYFISFGDGDYATEYQTNVFNI